MPKATKDAAKKRSVPTKRSAVIGAADTSAAPHSGGEDDITIMALNLAPGKLSAEMAAYFKKCEEKLGFIALRRTATQCASSAVQSWAR